MVTVQHSPLDDRIHYKQGRALVEAGYQVSIIHACRDGVLIGMDSEQLNEHSGDSVKVDGIELIPVAEPDSAVSRLQKKAFKGPFYKSMIEKARATRADLFIAHEPQSIVIAKKAGEENAKPFLFDAHESLHFDNAKDRFAKSKWMSELPYFMAANQLTANELATMNPSSPYEIIHNASLFAITKFETRTDLVMVHEGSFPFNRGLELMMDALIILKQDLPDFRLRIIGEFRKEAERAYFEEKVKGHHLQNHIEVTGWRPYLQVGQELHGMSLGLILNTFSHNNRLGGPANKLFNYINAGLCVVSVDLPETTRIVNETGCGVILKERSPSALASTLKHLHQDRQSLNDYRLHAHKAAPGLSWTEEKKKFIRFIESVLRD